MTDAVLLPATDHPWTAVMHDVPEARPRRASLLMCVGGRRYHIGILLMQGAGDAELTTIERIADKLNAIDAVAGDVVERADRFRFAGADDPGTCLRCGSNDHSLCMAPKAPAAPLGWEENSALKGRIAELEGVMNHLRGLHSKAESEVQRLRKENHDLRNDLTASQLIPMQLDELREKLHAEQRLVEHWRGLHRDIAAKLHQVEAANQALREDLAAANARTTAAEELAPAIAADLAERSERQERAEVRAADRRRRLEIEVGRIREGSMIMPPRSSPVRGDDPYNAAYAAALLRLAESHPGPQTDGERHAYARSIADAVNVALMAAGVVRA